MRRTLGILTFAMLALWLTAAPVSAYGTWTWPVVGPIIRGFDPPDSPFGPGHRGIDIVTPVGTIVRAPAPGVVSFAGSVGGHQFVTIDHGGGLLSTASFLSERFVRKGEAVIQGQPIGRSGSGHPGDLQANLHFGVRLDGTYVDPLDFLEPPSVVDLIRLAPI
jgi:murein DD-endopeptidase MepM/ murein hydrolase activator NlpD